MIKNVAIIGGGINSAVGRAHFAALKMLDNKFKIVAAVFSRDDKINSETANLFGGTNLKLFRNYYDMLHAIRSEVDVIIILSPTNNHFEHVLASLEMGFDVICEKSISLTVNEAKKLKDVSIEKGKKLVVMYNYLGYPMLEELKARVSSGVFGQLLDVQLEMPQEGYLLLKEGLINAPQDWRLEDRLIPTISLDLGVHLHIVLHHTCGLVPQSVAAIQTSAGPFNVIDNVKALVKYKNGISGSIWFSKVSLGNKNGLSIRIFGREGSVSWLQTNPEELVINDNKGVRYIIDRSSPCLSGLISNPEISIFKPGHPIGFVEAMKNYYLDSHAYLCDNPSSFTYGINEAILGLELLEKISHAAIKNCWVDFE